MSDTAATYRLARALGMVARASAPRSAAAGALEAWKVEARRLGATEAQLATAAAG